MRRTAATMPIVNYSRIVTNEDGDDDDHNSCCSPGPISSSSHEEESNGAVIRFDLEPQPSPEMDRKAGELPTGNRPQNIERLTWGEGMHEAVIKTK